MPSGKTHDKITYWLLLPVFVICYYALHLSAYGALLIAMGVWIGGIWLGPDLDTRSRPFYRWGLFRFIWWPYQWVAKHRSNLSHGIITGPLFRLLYFSAILIVTYFGLWHLFHQSAPLLGPRQELLSYIDRHGIDFLHLGIGVGLGSFFHVAADTIVSAMPFKKSR